MNRLLVRPYLEPKLRTVKTREAKEVRLECADCPNPRWVKPNGERARLCRACMDIDKERASIKRGASAQ